MAVVENVADLLSASSLLLAVLAVIYGLWYPEISTTLDIEPPLHLEDAAPDLRRVRKALRARAIPLTTAIVLLTVMFLPDAIHIVVDALLRFGTKGFASVADYDAVRATLVIVVIMSGALAWHMFALTIRLLSLRRTLEP